MLFTYMLQLNYQTVVQDYVDTRRMTSWFSTLARYFGWRLPKEKLNTIVFYENITKQQNYRAKAP